MAGVLTWISFVFTPGRPRRQFIYDAARLGTTGSKRDLVTVRGELQRQLRWWLHTLSASDFVGTRVWDTSACPDTMLMHSDASGEDGWGACIGNVHLVGPWPEELRDASMLFKELVPVVIILLLLAPWCDDVVFASVTDNAGVAFVLNALSCNCPRSIELLRPLVDSLACHRLGLVGGHAHREHNHHSDVMSHAIPDALWDDLVQGAPHCKRNRMEIHFVVHDLYNNDCFAATISFRRPSSLSVRNV